MATIRELHEQSKRAGRVWRSRSDGYAWRMGLHQEFLAAGEALRQRLPFRTSLRYAYSPRENVGSGGGTHILVEEAVTVGRVKREDRDALCKKKFWGLSEASGSADCLKCLEIAEKLAGAAEAERLAA